ncbi:Sphingolipid delta(4)-desaturase DES1-like [Sesamum angolense]|uniref:Sphingolipid delta(4)-desaturase DES1-like n=1 Tax=Sesamum angolense TaxID=2727404 RepID=A0AAE1W4I9_9LAMI|nr:Sphingolipid delta(4)-desaturase DES1-like [Sesamum angolense]
MGYGGKQRGDAEGAMATDFFWSYTDEPHASRRRQILSQYPQIKQLFGPDPFAFLKLHCDRGGFGILLFFIELFVVLFYWPLWESRMLVENSEGRSVLVGTSEEICAVQWAIRLYESRLFLMVVLLQLWTATFLYNASWMKILIVAYFFGSFLNHNLFLAIHELSHNLAFSTPVYNRWLGIFANLPIGVPMSVTFQKYHLEHHRYQGVDGVDMDVPSLTEAKLVTNVVSKSIWVIFQLFFYALRPLFLKPKPPGIWEFVNLIIQLALDVGLVHFWGWKALGYLILSTFVGGGMHPMAGHFISEHYVFNPDQETYSYYGPLNLMTWSVGYHNEHHDFPRIPGSKLHKVREIAPEFYENLDSYRSWSQVIYMYIMDRAVGPFSRMKRNLATKSLKKSE